MADLLADTLASCARIGVSLHGIQYVQNTATLRQALNVSTHTCDDYRRLCAELNAQPGEGRYSARGGHRIYDTTTRAGVTITHLCWPHLGCDQHTPDGDAA